MKVLIRFIFLLGISAQIQAQDFYSKSLVLKDTVLPINLSKNFNSFGPLEFSIAPQFGGLFNESFKYVKGISNLKMIYDDFDLGFKLIVEYKLIKNFTITHVCNIGLLKFNFNESENLQGAMVKATLCYKF